MARRGGSENEGDQARAGRPGATLAGLLVACAVAVAAPADDHRRGQEAFQRGDVMTAMRELRAPAQAGHAPAQTLLAFILDKADLPEDAVRWYREAAGQGDAEAHFALGSLLVAGRGVAKDEKQALMHFSKAAEAGHLDAAQVLAQAHRRGLHGLPPDARQAALWDARVAERRAALVVAAAASAPKEKK